MSDRGDVGKLILRHPGSSYFTASDQGTRVSIILSFSSLPRRLPVTVLINRIIATAHSHAVVSDRRPRFEVSIQSCPSLRFPRYVYFRLKHLGTSARCSIVGKTLAWGEAPIRGSRPFRDEFQAGYHHGSWNEMTQSASKERSVDFIRNLKGNVKIDSTSLRISGPTDPGGPTERTRTPGFLVLVSLNSHLSPVLLLPHRHPLALLQYELSHHGPPNCYPSDRFRFVVLTTRYLRRL